MANALYDKGREAFLGSSTGSISWSADTIKAVLVSSSYTPNTATHQFVTSITSSTGSVTAQTLSSKDSAAGVADAADVTFSTVAANSVWNYVVLFKDTGAMGTSQLICVLDTATGLPLTSSGGDIIISWDNGANKIFKL